jgi:hypothetical protein
VKLLRIFLTGIAVIAAMMGLTACDDNVTGTVTGKNPSVEQCKTPNSFALVITPTGADDRPLARRSVCVNEATYNKYEIGNLYP